MVLTKERKMITKTTRDRVDKYNKQCAATGQKIEQRHITRLNIYSQDPENAVDKSRKSKYHVKPGTQLLKKYKGKEYLVLVAAPDLFVCNGQSYKTLSAVAMQICGQKVSGYEFFGFNNKGMK
jgi:hypothetical protein